MDVGRTRDAGAGGRTTVGAGSSAVKAAWARSREPARVGTPSARRRGPRLDRLGRSAPGRRSSPGWWCSGQDARASVLAGGLDQRERDLPLPATRGTIFDRDGASSRCRSRRRPSSPTRTSSPTRPGRRGRSRGPRHARRGRRPRLADRTNATEPRTGSSTWTAGSTRTSRRASGRSSQGWDSSTRARGSTRGAWPPRSWGSSTSTGPASAGWRRSTRASWPAAGHAVIQQDRNGTLIPQAGGSTIPPVPGQDVVLTIDRDIEYRAQQALAAAVRRTTPTAADRRDGPAHGADPRDGELPVVRPERLPASASDSYGTARSRTPTSRAPSTRW